MMNDQSETQTKAFLRDTKEAMKRKLDAAKTDSIKAEDDIKTFTAAIAAIDLALER